VVEGSSRERVAGHDRIAGKLIGSDRPTVRSRNLDGNVIGVEVLPDDDASSASLLGPVAVGPRPRTSVIR